MYSQLSLFIQEKNPQRRKLLYLGRPQMKAPGRNQIKHLQISMKTQGGILWKTEELLQQIMLPKQKRLQNRKVFLQQKLLPKMKMVRCRRILPDQIVFQNPGSIRTGKTQMLRGGISDPRNKAIMKMLNMISIGERAGSGVPDIYSVWEDNGWQEPAIEETYGPDRTVLTLSFRKKATIKNDDKKATIKSGDKKVTAKKKALQDKIREFLRSNGESKTIIIAEAIGMKTTRTKELIHEMPDIEALGNNRNRTYRLKPYILSIDAKETEK